MKSSTLTLTTVIRFALSAAAVVTASRLTPAEVRRGSPTPLRYTVDPYLGSCRTGVENV